ncbi:MAG: OprO/OprP family phosphate-selective porin, partial [Pirellulales bacterium]|nr:OprO/OprP family phosphate-selective porin [Pirellulales bacterium]
ATFAAEGALYTRYCTCSGNWITSLESELFLNQPADKNILLDTAERRSYEANYDLDTLELSRLNVGVRNGDWEFRAGKMWTPFGRYYSQLWSNQLLDAPFIRTEAIRWRETGMSLRWDPGIWVLDAGIFNGQSDRDTNSAKALVARVGVDQENWTLGGSVKFHDGAGSEQQKTFNRHVGIDAMVSSGRWRLSSEVIYDEYGLRYGFDPLDIFWEKSIYYRDLNEADGVPISGVGYYVTVDYTGSVWIVSLSFGQFFPEEIGNALHDRTQSRGIVKLSRSFGKCLQAYAVVMVENEGYIAQELRPRKGTVILSGLQFSY